VQRETHDLTQKNIVLQEQEHRQTLKELFLMNFQQGSHVFNHLMDNPRFILNIALYTAGITTAFYFSKGTINYTFRYMEAHFGKPALIRETSRLSYKQCYKLPFKFL
jgi:hypothetical protein